MKNGINVIKMKKKLILNKFYILLCQDMIEQSYRNNKQGAELTDNIRYRIEIAFNYLFCNLKTFEIIKD